MSSPRFALRKAEPFTREVSPFAQSGSPRWTMLEMLAWWDNVVRVGCGSPGWSKAKLSGPYFDSDARSGVPTFEDVETACGCRQATLC